MDSDSLANVHIRECRSSTPQAEPMPNEPPQLTEVDDPDELPKYRYYLLCQLIVEAGQTTLRDVFNHIYPPITLADRLSKPQVKNVLTRLQTQKILSTKQWESLYPKRQRNINSENYDIASLCLLLQKICHISPPYPNGWEGQALPEDLGIAADISRLAYYRRMVVSINKVSQNDFQSAWTQICEILQRLAGSVARMKSEYIARQIPQLDQLSYYKDILNNWQQQADIVVMLESSTKDMDRHQSNARFNVPGEKGQSFLDSADGTPVNATPGRAINATPGRAINATPGRRNKETPSGHASNGGRY